MTPVETLKHSLRIIEEQQVEIKRLTSEQEVSRWLLEQHRRDVEPCRDRPLIVRFGPSPTFLAKRLGETLTERRKRELAEYHARIKRITDAGGISCLSGPSGFF